MPSYPILEKSRVEISVFFQINGTRLQLCCGAQTTNKIQTHFSQTRHKVRNAMVRNTWDLQFTDPVFSSNESRAMYLTTSWDSRADPDMLRQKEDPTAWGNYQQDQCDSLKHPSAPCTTTAEDMWVWWQIEYNSSLALIILAILWNYKHRWHGWQDSDDGRM